ncbi:hypothetical protein GALMADRAFT_1160972 [Galerina marginata CBS 339.88]|uniref:Uncharacterized protein n=1 Tax=Galerina marginata (strain CBS 339.88) TaxID=685588 RepID=A0A067SHJ2_GALM3|nr:hypothetical protein GALMADRAFT_1160972 [Galerina marginata CBS 339.88]
MCMFRGACWLSLQSSQVARSFPPLSANTYPCLRDCINRRSVLSLYKDLSASHPSSYQLDRTTKYRSLAHQIPHYLLDSTRVTKSSIVRHSARDWCGV